MESKAHFYAPRFEAGAGAQQDTDAGAAEAAAPLHLPLAEVQRGLWFVQQLARERAAHNLVFAARVTSTVDIAAIDAALHALIGRHAALRTRYIIDDTGRPRRTSGRARSCSANFVSCMRRLPRGAWAPSCRWSPIIRTMCGSNTRRGPGSPPNGRGNTGAYISAVSCPS